MHECMHTSMARLCVCACACALVHMHAVTSIKCFLTLKLIHYFIASLSRKTNLSKQNKMSNITNEKKDLEESTDIDPSFTMQ